MCDACKELLKVWDGSQQLLVSKFTNAKTGNPTFILVQDKENGTAESVVIKVNFCPWCGDKLRKDGAGE